MRFSPTLIGLCCLASAPASARDFANYYNQSLQTTDLHKQADLLDKAVQSWTDEDGPDRLTLAFLALSETQEKLGERAKAFEDLGLALKASPKSADALEAMGVFLYQEGNITDAYLNLDRAIHVNPAQRGAYLYRGLCHARHRDFQLAIADLDKAISLPPQEASYLNSRGYVYHLMHQPDKALADYQKAVQLNSAFITAADNAARTRQKLQTWKDELFELDNQVKKQPREASLRLKRAELHIELGDHAAALADLKDAFALDPQEPATYDLRGRILELEDRADDAYADYNRAIAIGKSNAAAYCHRAGIEARSRRYADAAGDYEKSMSLNPQFAEALHGRGLLSLETGKLQAAWTDLRKAALIMPLDAEIIESNDMLSKRLKREPLDSASQAGKP